MERYDYKRAVCEDIREYIESNVDLSDYSSKEDAYEGLYDELWENDWITGNASGSHTFNTWTAEENIAHNLDLLSDALHEFGCDVNVLEKGAEWCDVTIRCYLLGECLNEVLDEYEFNEEEEA